MSLEKIIEFINQHGICTILFNPIELHAGAHEQLLIQNEGRPTLAIGRCDFNDNEAWYMNTASGRHIVAEIEERCNMEIKMIDEREGY